VFDNSPAPGVGGDQGPPATEAGGGSSTVTSSDIPYVDNGGRAGPTFDPNSRDGLGIESLRQVP